MNTNYLKRTCELLLESSKDLVMEENTTEPFKKTRLYAMQVIDLLEETEESFIDLVFKINHDVVSSLDGVMLWINILVKATWYTGKNHITMNNVSFCEETRERIIVPILAHLGFSSSLRGRALVIKPMIDAKVDSMAHKYINHQYGDLELIRIRHNMYEAFMNRRASIHDGVLFGITKEAMVVYLANLKNILLRDLGLVLNTETLECTAHETHGEMLFDRLL